MATTRNRQPLEALPLTWFEQKKFVRPAKRSDFTLFTFDIAAVRQQHCGFVSSSLLFTLVTVFPITSHKISNK
jgi:hypothetical protein